MKGIKQIMPADGWWVAYQDGSYERLVGWALRDDGQVVGLVPAMQGVNDVTESGAFLRYVHRDEVPDSWKGI